MLNQYTTDTHDRWTHADYHTISLSLLCTQQLKLLFQTDWICTGTLSNMCKIWPGACDMFLWDLPNIGPERWWQTVFIKYTCWTSVLLFRTQVTLFLADIPMQALCQTLKPVVHGITETDGGNRETGCSDGDTMEKKGVLQNYFLNDSSMLINLMKRIHFVKKLVTLSPENWAVYLSSYWCCWC